MAQEIAKAYEPKDVETKWYATWEAAGCFRGELPTEQSGAATSGSGGAAAPSSDGTSRSPHAIVIPPPNVTGVLHMGHILNNTMQDILTRRARQEGKAAVWVPGTDHAGIATQARVEKALREEGLTKWDLGRETFVERAKEWRDKHGGIILEQLKKLGASCDWERTVHTLDTSTEKAHVTPGPDNAGMDYYRAVLTAFVELFRKGHIYRGKRMVNWCPKTQTALSEEEVIMKPQKGHLYKMRYEIAERPGEYVEISTTRPETLMGDTAVAVHPEDPRYKHLIENGFHAVRPFPKANIPFITDEHIDREFGTGVLKVTPAHDRADFDIYQRHQDFLDETFAGQAVIDVLTPDGKINCPDCPELHGLDRFAARKKAGEMLEAMGQLVEKEKYENNVGFSERADVPIEPRLSDQWWLRYPRVAEAKEAVARGKIKFYPERWTKTYQHWLENIQDWCISRQLWWGHRIPVWYRNGIDRATLTEEDLRDPEKVFVGVEGPADPENWEQEEDVLDTWASSWLWPFGVFGWRGDETREPLRMEPASTGESPDDPSLPAAAGRHEAMPPYPTKAKELNFWYPTEVLCTGPDIIFFWVARMIMAGLEFMGDVPFKHVVFNGIIRDAQGRKMSKSLGNSPDPLDLIDKFGADGLRLGMLMIAPKGADILFSEDRVQLGRNFCNKLWNACRFRLMQEGSHEGTEAQREEAELGASAPRQNKSLFRILLSLKPAQFDADDHAILAKLIATLEETEAAYKAFEFNKLTDSIYKFFWTDYCDWYVEVSKAELQSAKIRRDISTARESLGITSASESEHFPRVSLEEIQQIRGSKPTSSIGSSAAETKLAILDLCLRSVLQMLHPVTPFITEELWEKMGYGKGFIQDGGLVTAEKLRKEFDAMGLTLDADAIREVEQLQDFVVKARALKAQYTLAAKNDVTFYVVADATDRTVLDANAEKLKHLAGAGAIAARDSVANMPSELTALGNLYLDLAGSVDVEAERAKMQKQLDGLNKAIMGAEKKLENEKFVSNAPAEVIEGVKETLAANKAKREELERLMAALG